MKITLRKRTEKELLLASIKIGILERESEECAR